MFENILSHYKWNEITESIFSKSFVDVEEALHKEKRNLEDFKALISPAASKYLEPMARLSRELTLKRFGKTIQLFIPLYVSNVCENHCVYCGFNQLNKIKRKVLTTNEIQKEVKVLKDYGYEHLLLVSGEAPEKVGVSYFAKTIKMLKSDFALISIEVQPMETEEYQQLIEVGLNSVYIYQETYNQEKYKLYHPKGKKSDFEFRLNTPERLGNADIHKIGLGVLLGLEEWRTDSFLTALHLNFLETKFWKTNFSISFPRLRPHAGSFQPNSIVTEKDLVQLICAYRIFNEEVELSISVRESAKFRDNIIKLGITSLSAGSKTEPGGYAANLNTLEQFAVHDSRTPAEIINVIKNNGYEPVWKNWDPILQSNSLQ